MSFAVNVGGSETTYKTMIMVVYYEADWLPTPVYLLDSYTNEYMLIVGNYQSNYTGSVNLNEVPNGKHTITICAIEYGLYIIDESVYWFHSFSIEASAVIQINKLAYSIDIIGIFADGTEPTPTATPCEEPEQTEQDMTTCAILAVTSIVVFLGLLVFIKRR